MKTHAHLIDLTCVEQCFGFEKNGSLSFSCVSTGVYVSWGVILRLVLYQVGLSFILTAPCYSETCKSYQCCILLL